MLVAAFAVAVMIVAVGLALPASSSLEYGYTDAQIDAFAAAGVVIA